MILAELPEWADADFLKGFSAAMVLVAAALLIVTLIWAKSFGVRVVVLVLVAGGVFGLFRYRESIVDCEKTCDCSLFGEAVHVDACSGAAFDR